jgi:hypothetical protein
MAMKSIWDNLVAHWLVLVLVVLFAMPCLACEDAISHILCPHAQATVQAAHLATLACGCDISGTPHQKAPPCQCLSDASKVHNDRSANASIFPDATVTPIRVALSDPTLVRIADSWRVYILRPLLVHPAVAGRAPPAA